MAQIDLDSALTTLQGVSQGISYIISALLVVLESRGLGKRNISVYLSDSVSDMLGRSTGKNGPRRNSFWKQGYRVPQNSWDITETGGKNRYIPGIPVSNRALEAKSGFKSKE